MTESDFHPQIPGGFPISRSSLITTIILTSHLGDPAQPTRYLLMYSARSSMPSYLAVIKLLVPDSGASEDGGRAHTPCPPRRVQGSQMQAPPISLLKWQAGTSPLAYVVLIHPASLSFHIQPLTPIIRMRTLRPSKGQHLLQDA